MLLWPAKMLHFEFILDSSSKIHHLLEDKLSRFCSNLTWQLMIVIISNCKCNELPYQSYCTCNHFVLALFDGCKIFQGSDIREFCILTCIGQFKTIFVIQLKIYITKNFKVIFFLTRFNLTHSVNWSPNHLLSHMPLYSCFKSSLQMFFFFFLLFPAERVCE